MTKDGVLALLRAEDGFVSGERIREKLGVSRMAVSAAVKALRQEGYDIASVTNRGYRLNSAPDVLTRSEILANLTIPWDGELLCLDTVGSTNDKMKELALSGAKAGTVVVADEQTSGRGRRGRRFLSPKAQGVYISILLRPACGPEDSAAMTAYAAVGACRAILRAYGIRPGIKWVNDLVLDGRKGSGILTEMALESESGHVEYVIIGAGVNVNQTAEEFTGELKEKAGSLAMAAGHRLGRAKLAARMIEEMESLRRGYPGNRGEVLEAYRKWNVTPGRRVEFPEHGPKGVAVGINDDFSLRVELDGGKSVDVTNGDLAVSGLYGCP